MHGVLFQKPQHESKDKKLKVFNSGTVAMDVKLQRTVVFQGKGLKVIARIQNNSSRPIKLKYCLYRKHTFLATNKLKVITKDLLKEVGEPIPPSAKEKFTRVVPIPSDVEPSIENCSIIKVEYGLRVYLDVKFASDPEIKFPIVILPASWVPAASGFSRPPGASDRQHNTSGWRRGCQDFRCCRCGGERASSQPGTAEAVPGSI
ncbi:Arrestin domain-containing protein 3 [Liparis tanakae]|uniref:Arrestin domain-containing protein 3 n=1 Tax=Liparis tanakae TaxID=230148 RepID=A0A4Z2E7K8_9TELE|nr:Arrestin domain-containing protein 3 [Liparis tanakae]